METLLYLNALHTVLNIRSEKFFQLLSFFDNSLKLVWTSSQHHHLSKILGHKGADRFISQREKLDPEKEIFCIQKHNIKIFIHPDLPFALPKYPLTLSQIPNPPTLLYVIGDIRHLFKTPPYKIAIVGSRRISTYGRTVTELLAYEIAKYKIEVISGLAYGVDTVAHAMCIKAGTPTYAILANGLNYIYPPLNTKLVHTILSHDGALISEFPLNTPPRRTHFPQRNRIISGLANSVLITEAALPSGSLLTAYHAIEQNKEVLAVPGSIFNKNSQGTNHLIIHGAHPVVSIENILDFFHITQKTDTKIKNSPLSPEAQTIFNILSKEPQHITTFVKILKNFEANRINTLITQLEMQGLVKNIGGGYYIQI